MAAQKIISIEHKLEVMGLSLPKPMKAPAGVSFPFPFVKVHGNMAYISGHLPLEQDGQISDLRGKLGDSISLEEGYESAKLAALSVLASLKEALGYLDRVQSWLRVFGMVNCTPDFELHPKVINGFSDLIRELYGPERGFPARSAVGMGSLPFQVPVEIEAIVEISNSNF